MAPSENVRPTKPPACAASDGLYTVSDVPVRGASPVTIASISTAHRSTVHAMQATSITSTRARLPITDHHNMGHKTNPTLFTVSTPIRERSFPHPADLDIHCASAWAPASTVTDATKMTRMSESCTEVDPLARPSITPRIGVLLVFTSHGIFFCALVRVRANKMTCTYKSNGDWI